MEIVSLNPSCSQWHPVRGAQTFLWCSWYEFFTNYEKNIAEKLEFSLSDSYIRLLDPSSRQPKDPYSYLFDPFPFVCTSQ